LSVAFDFCAIPPSFFNKSSFHSRYLPAARAEEQMMARMIWWLAAAFVLASLSSAAAQTSEAAGAFGCPPISGKGADLPDVRSAYDMLKGADAATIENRVDDVIATLRARSVDGTLIVDALIAAYCPAVAAETGLSTAERKTRLANFARQVTALVFPQRPRVDAVIVDLPLPPDLLQQVDDAARKAQLSRDTWLAQAIHKALQAGK
jgi:hypothetical protein